MLTSFDYISLTTSLAFLPSSTLALSAPMAVCPVLLNTLHVPASKENIHLFFRATLKTLPEKCETGLNEYEGIREGMNERKEENEEKESKKG